MIKSLKYIFPVLFLVALTSCDRGYQLRVANYYTEDMDSVVVGNNTLVFKKIPSLATSGFEDIKKGTYNVVFITSKKNKFYSKITIPNHGTGKRTLEIDAIEQIQLLEE